jgi:hypothetical protein
MANRYKEAAKAGVAKEKAIRVAKSMNADFFILTITPLRVAESELRLGILMVFSRLHSIGWPSAAKKTRPSS